MNYIPLSQRKNQTQGNPIDLVMEKLARVESGGDYSALGPTVEKGQYAGEQAMGKYQIMPGNIPSWSKEALGYEVSPQEFYQSPELQEQITRDRISKIYEQYGNPDDVASVWFTGRPVSKVDPNVSDVTGTTNTEYLRRFNEGSETQKRYVPLAERKML
jgi:hypothetical protein